MSEFTGTGALIRLALRRSRVALTTWAVITVAFPLLNAAALRRLLATDAQIQEFVRDTAGNVLVLAFHGPIHGTTGEALVAWRSLLQLLFAAALGAIFLVIRHTRADEDAGRRELIGAGAVGRQAPLAAALAVVVGVDLIIGVGLATLLIGLCNFAVEGSVALALVVAASGALFAGVAAVAAQIGASASAARRLALLALAVAWALRMIGHAGPVDGALARLVWLTPIGWAGEVRPYAGEQWWIVTLFAAAVAGLMALAFALSARRDLGAGLLPTASGAATAPASLGGVIGLAWRLQRGLLVGVAVMLGLLGAAFGWVAASFTGLLSSSPALAAWLAPLREASLGDAFLALMIYVLVAFLVSGHAIAAALRSRAEEEAGHLAWILATPASRLRWWSSHALFALGGPVVLALVIGVAVGLTDALATGRPDRLAHGVGAALVHVPATWVLASLAMLLFGRTPRPAAAAAWCLLGLFAMQVSLWEAGVIGRPWLNPLAYTHPMLAPNPLHPLALALVAAGLLAAGGLAFRARDVR
ncbi:ABC transporter permease [Nannocystis pusilla]|uniref:ABC transporter permease n=1 Tax=Nannocystis pusilla TaxID=889268 RepID=A0ABS7TIF9_9BACT|nr:hypothetical protein [Nannocystis pusilla]MBZ5707897.1 hypothetical protein [Nannocystis pusilla]